MHAQLYYILANGKHLIGTDGAKGFSKSSAHRQARSLMEAHPKGQYIVLTCVPITQYGRFVR